MAAAAAGGHRPASGRIRFTDKDEHMYFWFPLLAGLSELTFDPRPEIRCGSSSNMPQQRWEQQLHLFVRAQERLWAVRRLPHKGAG